jgi:hypothetical protein
MAAFFTTFCVNWRLEQRIREQAHCDVSSEQLEGGLKRGRLLFKMALKITGQRVTSDGITTKATAKTIAMLSGALGFCAAFAVVTPAAADPRGVIELFTSQGCSSCPPADKVLGDLAKDPSLIALSLPVDYWDYLGWKDTLADPRFSARQKAYSGMRGDRDVYTPQVVVNGTVHVLGSDKNSIETAVESTHNANVAMSVPVTMTKSGKQIDVTVANGSGKSGEVWICAVSKQVPIKIGRGENRGTQITYHNVVRSVLKVGDWNGKAGSWSVPIENIAHEGVDAAVVYVQDGNRDKPGMMLGAAFTSLN